MAFNTSRKLADNISAIRIALDYKGDRLSPAEMESLGRYAGFGGIKAILFPSGDINEWKALSASETDLKLHPQVMQLHELLSEKLGTEYQQTIESLKNSVLTAFYTPDFVPEIVYAALKQNNIIPRRIYEPSAGAGAFVFEAAKAFPGVKITAVEKDLVTGRILSASCAGAGIDADIQIRGLEETPSAEKGYSDLVISNIPFGNFSVHDPAFGSAGITSKIHNYFFAKGLDKLADGGILAYLVTDGFLNSPSNSSARKLLLTSADLLSLSVLPANLMKDSSGVEVGTHLIITQKNDHKNVLSDAERLLLDTVEMENSYGKYQINAFVAQHPELVLGNEVFEGTNAYGKAARTIWQTGDLLQIADPLKDQIIKGLSALNLKKWKSISFDAKTPSRKQLTFLTVPVGPEKTSAGQLGLFDTAPAANHNKAGVYLSELDKAIVNADSTRQVSTIRTTARPDHDSLALLTARSISNARYLYKLISNVSEISVPNKWLTGQSLGYELNTLSVKLRYFAHDYRYEGDTSLEGNFKLQADRPKPFTDLLSFYEKGTLVISEGQMGIIGDISGSEAEFKAFDDQHKFKLYKAYIAVRDAYMQLSLLEAKSLIPFPEMRTTLNNHYDIFVSGFGELNNSRNRSLILADEAFGFKMLSSLEVRSDNGYLRSDIFSDPLFHRQEQLRTDNPVDALARCLNDLGTGRPREYR